MKHHISFDLSFKKNTYPGKFIVFEGIDGSGKTTQIEKVKEALFKKGTKDIVTTKEPTENIVGELIHKILQKKVKVEKTSLQYLFCADRAMHLKEVIEPNLKEGRLVLSDRYFWSSVAYGLQDKGVLDYESLDSMLVLESILSMYDQFLLPDLTFYLNVSAETAFKRLKEKKKLDLYEQKEKLVNIVKGYKLLIDKFPQNFIVIDGEKSEQEVTGEILSHLSTLSNLRNL